jgi:hypothetical protein
MNLLSLIVPALLPAISDGFKGLFQKIFGGTKPITVDDQIKLMAAETEKLKVIAELDRPAGEISRWVADLRASFRYIAAGMIILATILCLWTPGVKDEFVDLMLQLTASVFSFMFGDRVYLHLRGR